MHPLLEAVDSGDPSAVREVVGIIGDHEAAKQMSALCTNDSRQLETIIMRAARGGDVDMFHTVRQSLQQILTTQQVRRVVKEGRPVLR